MEKQRNVFGENIKECSCSPMTGFYRDGLCNTDSDDVGSHTICAQVTEDFLSYSKNKGNDLSTPVPEFGFAGLKEGDRWCLCAERWKEAFEDGKAPKVVLESTNEEVLKVIPLENLKQYAIDLV